MKQYRPKIKINPSFLDYTLEFISLMVLAQMWTVVILSLQYLPDTIPIHFNFSGEADGFGSKYTIYILPIIGTIIYIGLTLLNQFPNVFNFAVELNEQNAEIQYKIACRMLRFVKTGVIFVFNYIVLSTFILISWGINLIGLTMIPILLICIFVPIIYYIIQSVRNK